MISIHLHFTKINFDVESLSFLLKCVIVLIVYENLESLTFYNMTSLISYRVQCA